MKKLLCFAGLLVLVVMLAESLGIQATASKPVQLRCSAGCWHTYHLSLTILSPVHSILGKPTIAPAFIDRELAVRGSPAAGTGQALYDLGAQAGIDPAYALAFFWHESRYGATGVARVTRSLGNERCLSDRPCIDRDRGGYALMNSWVDGYAHWYALLLFGYIQGQINRDLGRQACPCTTLEQIIPVYAPASDGNDEQAYINAVLTNVAAYRAGQL